MLSEMHLEERAAFARVAVLVKEMECPFLRLVPLASQVLESLAAGSLLTAANNPPMFILNKVRLDKATGGVLRRSVENLSFGTNCGNVDHLILLTAIFFNLRDKS